MINLNKNNFQNYFKGGIYLIAGILFSGAILDSVANSLGLISFSISVFGTLFLIFVWILLYRWISKNKPYWGSGVNKVRILKPNYQVNLFLIGIIMTLWIPYILCLNLQVFPNPAKNTVGTINIKNFDIVCDRDKDLGCYINMIIDHSKVNRVMTEINDEIWLNVPQLMLFIELGDYSYSKSITGFPLITKKNQVAFPRYQDYSYVNTEINSTTKNEEPSTIPSFNDKPIIPFELLDSTIQSPYNITYDGTKLLFDGIVRDFKTGELIGWFDHNEFEVNKPCAYSWNKDSIAVEIIDRYGNVCFSVEYEYHGKTLFERNIFSINFQGYFVDNGYYYVFSNSQTLKTKDENEALSLITKLEPRFKHIGNNSLGKRNIN